MQEDVAVPALKSNSVPNHLLCQYLLFSTNLPLSRIQCRQNQRSGLIMQTIYSTERTKLWLACRLEDRLIPHLTVIYMIQFTILQGKRGIFHSMLSCTDVPRLNISTCVLNYNLCKDKNQTTIETTIIINNISTSTSPKPLQPRKYQNQTVPQTSSYNDTVFSG